MSHANPVAKSSYFPTWCEPVAAAGRRCSNAVLQVVYKVVQCIAKILSALPCLRPLSQKILSALPIHQVKNPATPEEKTRVLQAIHQLGLSLELKIAAKTDKSFCISPLSIALVLSMAVKAMSEENKTLFLQKMQLENMSNETFQNALFEILYGLEGTVKIANGIALTQLGAKHIDSQYKREIQDQYAGELFSADDNADVGRINRWVSVKTEGLIPNFFSAQDMPNGLMAVLLNAVYFSAKWEKQFAPACQRPFYLPGGNQVQVQMMHIRSSFKFFQGPNFGMVEIPYQISTKKGDPVSFLIFLPHSLDSAAEFSQLESQLTPTYVQHCRAQAQLREIQLAMPKINLEFKETQILEALVEMGFPLQSALPLLGPNLQIGKIIHQSKLVANEKETQAAAATAAAVMLASASSPALVLLFTADRNFAYTIVSGNTVLFQGAIKDETALVK